MKQYLLATVSSLALISAASAADLRPLPTKAPPPAAVVWSWQGLYVGINGGVARHHADYSAFDTASDYGWSHIRSTSATFGGQIGFNLQTGNFVYGAEADLNWLGRTGSAGISQAGPFATQTFTYTSRLAWLATVRGRVGFAIAPPTLVYATGGYAVGRIEDVTSPGNFGAPPPPGFPPLRETKSGWTAGGGVEHMFRPNWTARVEALYVDLGDTSVRGSLGPGYLATFRHRAILGRAGLNLKW